MKIYSLGNSCYCYWKLCNEFCDNIAFKNMFNECGIMDINKIIPQILLFHNPKMFRFYYTNPNNWRFMKKPFCCVGDPSLYTSIDPDTSIRKPTFYIVNKYINMLYGHMDNINISSIFNKKTLSVKFDYWYYNKYNFIYVIDCIRIPNHWLLKLKNVLLKLNYNLDNFILYTDNVNYYKECGFKNILYNDSFMSSCSTELKNILNNKINNSF